MTLNHTWGKEDPDIKIKIPEDVMDGSESRWRKTAGARRQSLSVTQGDGKALGRRNGMQSDCIHFALINEYLGKLRGIALDIGWR